MTTASIVLYNNELNVIRRAIESFVKADLEAVLFLVDNSPTTRLSVLEDNERIKYIHNPSNPGFGAGHNIAINLAMRFGSKYHFVINPDIYFGNDVITKMIGYMMQHPEVGMMMPEVLNDDGSVQFLPKLLPSPFWILKRKFKIPVRLHTAFVNMYELRDVPRKTIYNAPILSGCFSLLNLSVISETGAYDDKYFMYFEDFDLSRRIHKKYKTIYFPDVSVYHNYESGANKSLKLFGIFLSSAFIYFNKWGWFFDMERKRMNEQTLKQL